MRRASAVRHQTDAIGPFSAAATGGAGCTAGPQWRVGAGAGGVIAGGSTRAWSSSGRMAIGALVAGDVRGLLISPDAVHSCGRSLWMVSIDAD